MQADFDLGDQQIKAIGALMIAIDQQKLVAAPLAVLIDKQLPEINPKVYIYIYVPFMLKMTNISVFMVRTLGSKKYRQNEPARFVRERNILSIVEDTCQDAVGFYVSSKTWKDTS